MDKYTAAKEQLEKQIIKKKELEVLLNKLEDNIYEQENDYLNTSAFGNIVKGFENFGKGNTGGSNKKRLQITDEDHIFSLSSSTFVKNLAKRKGQGQKDDFDNYEDTVEQPQQTQTENGVSNGNGNIAETNSDLPGSNFGRKRKIRTFDD